MTTLPALMNGAPICVAEKTHEGGRASLRFGLGECQCGFRQNYVLVTRLVALMLSGVAPEKLLCLTYTRSAAAEMQERLFALLSDGRSCRMRNWPRKSKRALK